MSFRRTLYWYLLIEFLQKLSLGSYFQYQLSFDTSLFLFFQHSFLFSGIFKPKSVIIVFRALSSPTVNTSESFIEHFLPNSRNYFVKKNFFSFPFSCWSLVVEEKEKKNNATQVAQLTLIRFFEQQNEILKVFLENQMLKTNFLFSYFC